MRLDNLYQSFKWAARSLLRQPRFTVPVVVILALGIGANTAMFTVTYRILLRPLSYRQPDQLVRLWPGDRVDKLLAHEVAQKVHSFAAVSAYQSLNVPVGGGGEPAVVRAAKVGTAHFQVLGANPVLGRAFVSDDGVPGQQRVAVLSHGLWTRRYGAEPGVLGRKILVDGDSYEIIGVMGKDFEAFPQGTDLYLPLTIDPNNQKDYLSSFYLGLIGRLRPDVSQSSAQAELQTITKRLRRTYPNLILADRVAGARVVPLREDQVGHLRGILLLLQAAVALVLLIACGNIANLVLARAINGTRDAAVRAAIGAGRGRLIQRVVAESTWLGLLGGAAGLLAGDYTLGALRAWLPSGTPRLGEVGLDGTVILFNFALALGVAVFLGLTGLRGLFKIDVHSELNEGGSGLPLSRRGRQMGRLLLMAQIAGATMLLISSAVLLRSLTRLQDTAGSLDRSDVLTVRLDLPQAQYQAPPTMVDFYSSVLSRVRRLPGVSAAGAVHLLPLSSDNWSFPYLAEGNAMPPGTDPTVSLPTADFRIVTPGYFQALGVNLLAGRTLDRRDGPKATAVGLVNARLARLLWGLDGSVGRKIQLFGNGGPIFTVVGVVGDVPHRKLGEAPEPTIYRPLTQWPVGSMYLVTRSNLQASSLIPALRTQVWDVDRNVPISRTRSMSDVVRASVSEQRLTGSLVTLFGALALVLSIFGVYSVHSYAVAQRTREFGIRLTLGAPRQRLVMGVLREALEIAAVGLLIGLFGALLAAKSLGAYLYNLSPLDPVSYTVTLILIAATSVISSLLPAWRAMRSDPLETLRSQ